MKKNTWMLVIITLMIMFSGCGEIEVDAPTGFGYEYSEANHTVRFSWEEVSDATGYQIDYGNGKSIYNVGSKPVCVLNEPLDGDTFTARVRAVCEKDDEIYYSEWTSLEYTVPIYLGMPSDITFEMNGRVLEFDWEVAKGATGYEVSTNYNETEGSEPVSISSNHAEAMVSGGETGTLYVRAVRTKDTETYYSDWVSVDYSVPVINYEDVTYGEAFMLDYNRLLKWAEYYEYAYEVTEEVLDNKTYMVVDVYRKDSINSGFLNAADRVIGSVVDGFWNGYVEETESSHAENFSTVGDTIMTFIQSDGIEGYVNDVDESAKESGVVSAINEGLEALLVDTKIHHIFYYENYDNAAMCSMSKFLANGREDFDAPLRDRTTDAEGFYDGYSEDFQQDFKFKVEKMNMNSYDYWIAFYGKE